jgi:hypothetical protein
MAEFKSPFDDLGVVRPKEISGSMECYTCYENATTGIYNPLSKTLVYVCPAGHETVLENYNL